MIVISLGRDRTISTCSYNNNPYSDNEFYEADYERAQFNYFRAHSSCESACFDY